MMVREQARIISKIGGAPGGGERKGFGFEPIQFVGRRWADDDYGQRYHVFRDPEERVTVQAASAVEAIKLSGVKRPYKVLRGNVLSEQRAGLIQKGRLVTDDSA